MICNRKEGYFDKAKCACTFVTRDYFERVVDESIPTYFDKMNNIDLKARRARSKQEYIAMYKNTFVRFTTAEQKQLRKAATEADTYIAANIPELHAIPWKFAKFDILSIDAMEAIDMQINKL